MMDRPIELTFAGAAGTVTGSRHLISVAGHRVLLDCGLFQGPTAIRERNHRTLSFEPRELAAVVLSHGHLDHCGYLPALVRQGFAGQIHCTPGTAELAAIVLRDAARLQQEDMLEAAGRSGSRIPAGPLFTLEDVDLALQRLVTHGYGQPFPVTSGTTALFRRTGHILGSASIELDLREAAQGQEEPLRLLFSGDLGRWGRPILRDPELVPRADILLVESTYGDRVHAADSDAQLAALVNQCADQAGVIVVPAFAIGRTQELIWTLRQLEDQGRVPSIPVYIDSSMGINVSAVYCRHPEDHDLDMKQLMDEERCPLCEPCGSRSRYGYTSMRRRGQTRRLARPGKLR